MATSRKQNKIERLTKDAETFNADDEKEWTIIVYEYTDGMHSYAEQSVERGVKTNEELEAFVEQENEFYGGERTMSAYIRGYLTGDEWKTAQRLNLSAETFEGELKVGVLGDFEGHEEGKLGADKVATYTLDNGKIVEVYECYTIMSKDGMVTGKRIDFYDLFDKEGSLNEGEPWWPEAGVPSREVVNDVFGAESFNAPAAVMRTYKGRKSPALSAKSVKVGTRKRGNDGKMWQVRSVRSRGKRTQRWFRD